MLFDKSPNQEDVNKAMADRARDMSPKINFLFFVRIASIVGNLFLVFVLISAMMSGDKGSVQAFSVFSSLISGVFGIAYGIVVIKLGEYYEEFKTAGICYLVYAIVSALSAAVGIAATNIVTAVLVLVYIFKFAEAVKMSLYGIDESVSNGWNILLLFYKILLAVLAFCILLAFVPGINILALLVIYLCVPVAVGISIYELVLLKMTANSLGRFASSSNVPRTASGTGNDSYLDKF